MNIPYDRIMRDAVNRVANQAAGNRRDPRFFSTQKVIGPNGALFSGLGYELEDLTATLNPINNKPLQNPDTGEIDWSIVTDI